MAILSAFMISFIFTIVILYLVNRLRQPKNARPLPPGQMGIPILGNVNDMPKPGILECHHWLEHKDLYGPISSVTVLGQTFVIINDAQIAFELMRGRSAIHSSRPGQIFSGQMVGWRHATAMSPYNDSWKTRRKNINKIASTNTSISVFDRVQEAETAHFLVDVLEAPDKLFDHIRKQAGSVILKVTYGYNTVPRGNDPFVDLATKTMVQFADAITPGRWTVDILPFLRYVPDWVPGTGFKETARRMAVQLIQYIGSDREAEFVHKWAALALYLGGADTTVSAIITFFLAITVFPEVQKKAQEELDQVIGLTRLPVSSDKLSLPYIEACMLETHRWHQVLPMCLPHMSTVEDVCRGYRIPKGAVLMPNNWWFTHDPATYPDPMTFRPERFITTPTHKVEPDPRNFVFGYGRRTCPGRYVADNAVFITIAQSLAVFNVSKAMERGKVIEPEVKFKPGSISHPMPFKCDIKPRSEEHAELIKKMLEEYPWEESDAKELENIRW
ncbi:cytochrome P450 [Bimuria novae-zelandiae CBS 107.79]|uniref:Cytochrome P450 n=1 Tax=Bimuria novae-zelandiae CBS 107.79 TaxID=1447943 RepID=A0A6A5VLK8_9PLEO|nr:cytochrome P450 [Bimuria novae-zelandiae CBS 107.79]